MAEENLVARLIELAIAEDIGDGDHSSLASIPHSEQGKVMLLVKESGIIAGVDMAKKIFATVDNSIVLELLISDGAAVSPGDTVLRAEGRVHSLLQAERLVLNVMQRMSGIATCTANYVKHIEGTEAKILDTRKTTPGMRLFDKEAVRIGGGVNHRMGLYDMVMLKDNHIDFAGGISKAIDGVKQYLQDNNKQLKIEVEVRNLQEMQEVLQTGGVHRIMLDNFSIEATREAVEIINRTCEVESSGGITLEDIRDYAKCGVDYISVGALTHNVKSLDLSLKAY